MVHRHLLVPFPAPLGSRSRSLSCHASTGCLTHSTRSTALTAPQMVSPSSSPSCLSSTTSFRSSGASPTTTALHSPVSSPPVVPTHRTPHPPLCPPSSPSAPRPLDLLNKVLSIRGRVLLGRRASVLVTGRRLLHLCGLLRRVHPEPDLRGGLQVSGEEKGREGTGREGKRREENSSAEKQRDARADSREE